jgi:DNA-binding IclR family transcriptional regulator
MEASTRVVMALGRLKNLFLEFPDTLLSLDEAAAVVGLESHQCHALLAALEDVRFLERHGEGRYGLRLADGPARSASGGMIMSAKPRRRGSIAAA